MKRKSYFVAMISHDNHFDNAKEKTSYEVKLQCKLFFLNNFVFSVR